jgi:hypothetical protein
MIGQLLLPAEKCLYSVCVGVCVGGGGVYELGGVHVVTVMCYAWGGLAAGRGHGRMCSSDMGGGGLKEGRGGRGRGGGSGRGWGRGGSGGGPGCVWWKCDR